MQEIYLNSLFMVGGVLLLYFGAEFLIKGSASFALRLGLTPLVVGLTVVGYGTGMPELIVSIDASLMGRGEIALGNVIGSNICNIGLVLGLSTLIKPMIVKRQLVRIDAPIMIGVSILLPLILSNGYLSRPKGLILLLGLFAYTAWAIYYSKTHSKHGENVEVEEEVPHLNKNIWMDWFYIALGFVGLWIGARLFVTATVSIAKVLGVNDAVIGLSVVALGTSLPELATSIIAIMKNHRDLAIGNLVGSNIFNILAIVGATGLIHPFAIEGINFTDYAVMILFASTSLLFMVRGLVVKRWEGALLLCGYFVYIFYLYQTENFILT